MMPYYDPYDEIERCKTAIQDLAHAVNNLVDANNIQAEQINRLNTRVANLNERVREHESQ